MLCSLYHSGDDAQLRSISTIVSGAIAALLFVIIIILVVLIAILYFRKKSQRKQKLSLNTETGINRYCNSGKCTCYFVYLLIQYWSSVMLLTHNITCVYFIIQSHESSITQASVCVYLGCSYV